MSSAGAFESYDRFAADEPAPAVQPKQCGPVTIRLESNLAGSNFAID